MRTTMDIDAHITGMRFDETTVEKMINEIINVKIDDDVFFEVDKSIPIKEDNTYGGYRFKITAKLGNMKIPFSLDISTGDIIIPSQIEYNYKTILENENISLYTYNNETIICEKIETVLKRNTANSRMKDYYDLYYFATYKWNELDIGILRRAIITIFEHRGSTQYLKNFNEIIGDIKQDKMLNERWEKYRAEHKYAKDIEYNDTIKAIEQIYRIV